MSLGDKMRYVMLLRGVNMMGKNTLVMRDLAEHLTKLGLKNVAYYINSGNVFFDSRLSVDKLYIKIAQCLFDNHKLKVDFVLIAAKDLQDEWQNLPLFWHDDTLKKQVAFFMPNFDVDNLTCAIEWWQSEHGFLHIGKTACFWAGDKDGSLYNHAVITPKLLKNLSIRNGKTFERLFKFL